MNRINLPECFIFYETKEECIEVEKILIDDGYTTIGELSKTSRYFRGIWIGKNRNIRARSANQSFEDIKEYAEKTYPGIEILTYKEFMVLFGSLELKEIQDWLYKED